MRLRRVALFVALLTGLTTRVCGQASFNLSVSDSPDPVDANQSLTYFISVTNRTGILLSDVFVTNRFSGPVQVIGTTNSRAGIVFTSTNSVVFLTDSFPGAGETNLLLSLVVRPTAFGSLTNTITVAAFNLNTTNATTNVVTQVIAGQPDLAIAIRGPTQPVLVNDWMSYALTVSNVGGDAAPNVIVSNILPADLKIISVVPSNNVVTTSNFLQWSVGRLGIGEFSNLTVTVQPTNAGVAAFFASVSAANVLDTNTVNNTASTNIIVEPLLAGSLVASNVSAMVFNPQSGLMEQTVRLVNVGTTSAPSARIIVSELTNRLFNAVGTNDGNPFVVYGAALEANQSVDLLFEYFIPTRLPVLVDDSQLHPFAMPASNLAPPGGTPFLITLVTNLPNGDILIEFPSLPGRSYTVLYSTNPGFTNELAAQPSIIAPADRVQWIDDGPPKTVSRPASVSERFYRVIQNP